jgi:hypothetical protein
MTNAAASQTICGTRLQHAVTGRGRLGILFVKPSKVEDCGICFLLIAFDAKEPEQPPCHAFVSELSFLCCAPEPPGQD